MLNDWYIKSIEFETFIIVTFVESLDFRKRERSPTPSHPPPIISLESILSCYLLLLFPFFNFFS